MAEERDWADEVAAQVMAEIAKSARTGDAAREKIAAMIREAAHSEWVCDRDPER